MDLKNIYNRITMCIHLVTRLQDNLLLLTSTSKENLSFKDTLSQIVITLPIIGIHIPTIILITPLWWTLEMKLV